MYNVVVTGSRSFKSYAEVARALGLVIKTAQELGHTDIHVIDGGCPTGADAHKREFLNIIEKSMVVYGVKVTQETMKAKWYREGYFNPGEGPIRNQKMIDTKPDVVLAFYQDGEPNKGTSDCVKRALEAKIEVIKYHSN